MCIRDRVNGISFTNPFTGNTVGFNFPSIGKIPYLAQDVYKRQAMEAQAQQISFKCAVCGKEYKTEKALTEHIAKVHPDTDSPEK